MMRQGEEGPGRGRGWRRMGWGGGWRARLRRRGGGEGAGAAPAASWVGLSLNDLRPGAQGRVWRLHGQGAIRQRLLDLGLLPGTEVTVMRSAPLDDPIEIRVGDAFLTLRRSEAMMIEMCHA